MYNDRSSNFMTALQCVDAAVGGLHSGLASGLMPGVDYGRYQSTTRASVSDYNSVVRAHNRLLGEVERLELLLQMRDAEIEILRRRAARR